MVLFETFGLHLFKFCETHLRQNVPFPNFPHAKKSSRGICPYFDSFVDILGIRWYELK